MADLVRTIFSDEEVPVEGEDASQDDDAFEVAFDSQFTNTNKKGDLVEVRNRIKDLVTDDSHNRTKTTSLSEKVDRLLKKKGRAAGTPAPSNRS